MKSAAGALLAAVVGVCVGIAGVAIGQSAVSLDRVEVALWPEYDRPGVLVIYRIAIAPSTSLPAPLSITIPTAAGVPNAVAQLSGGSLISLPYDRVVEGDRAVIRFAASEPTVQIEYYDPSIDRADGTRSFVYEWPGDYSVGDLSFKVQEPAGVQEFATSPPAGSAAVGADGLAYHALDTGSMAQGQTARVALSYRKEGEQLTVQVAPPPTAAPPTPQQAPPSTSSANRGSGGSGSDWTTYLIAGVLVLGLAGLALGLAARFRDRGVAERSPAPRGGGKRFCTACGASLRTGDRFCGSCGRKAREAS
jgi:hypothetical protein